MMTYAQYCRLNVSVQDTNRTVIERASKMLRNRFNPAERTARHEFYRGAIERHIEARELYRKVANGFYV